ncbi:MAG: YeeE/YedE family protein [Candidatus Bathyarchaeota archaeon]|nr:MAG: YeeE/YedE family protein [Candidatus Bathyarchaeota archaeon]
MKLKHLFVFIGGLFFGFGLAFGGMSKQEIVLSFLQLQDYGLLLLLGGSALVTALTINLVPLVLKNPPLGGKFQRRIRALNRRVIIGAAIFGVGWGISGICPGSSLASLGVGNLPILLGIASMFLGAYVMGRFFSR